MPLIFTIVRFRPPHPGRAHTPLLVGQLCQGEGVTIPSVEWGGRRNCLLAAYGYTESISRYPDSVCVLLSGNRTLKLYFTYFILFYSILFYSILFYSILFYSILFYSILFYSILFYSILFCSMFWFY